MPNSSFEKADKIYPHDRLLAKTILRFIPERITPNHITVFRFLATPVVVLLMIYEEYQIGLLAFLLVAFTDAIDGSMARTRNQITEWGKVFDPLADKILIASMIFIIVLKYIDVWTSAVIVVLEIIIITAAWIRKREGRVVQSNIWGKIKMGLQVLGVAVLLISIISDWANLLPFASGALYLAIAFAVISLLTHGI